MSAEVENMEGSASPTAPAPSKLTLSRRHLVMGGALLAVSGLALAREPKRRYPDLSTKQFEAMFPATFGTWRPHPASEIVMPPESELADKLYQHIFTRTYVDGTGTGVMFLAAYNSMQINNVQVHRPEVCYYAGGFSIDISKPLILPLGPDLEIPARTVLASGDSRKENILYWTRIGDEFPQSQFQQRIAMTKANIEGYLPDGLLLRMSVINPDNAASVQRMNGFMRELLAHSSPQARRLMVGKA